MMTEPFNPDSNQSCTCNYHEFSIICFSKTGEIVLSSQNLISILGSMPNTIQNLIKLPLPLNTPRIFKLQHSLCDYPIYIDACIHKNNKEFVMMLTDVSILHKYATKSPIQHQHILNPCYKDYVTSFSSNKRQVLQLSGYGIINAIYPRQLFCGLDTSWLQSHPVTLFVDDKDKILLLTCLSLSRSTSVKSHLRWIAQPSNQSNPSKKAKKPAKLIKLGMDDKKNESVWVDCFFLYESGCFIMILDYQESILQPSLSLVKLCEIEYIKFEQNWILLSLWRYMQVESLVQFIQNSIKTIHSDRMVFHLV